MGCHLLEELERMRRKYMTISNVTNNTSHYWTSKTITEMSDFEIHALLGNNSV
jgi:hypothetical protein